MISGASTASESEIGVTGDDRGGARVRKPKALHAGSRFAVIAPASPGHAEPEARGVEELLQLGFSVELRDSIPSQGYFAASAAERRAELLSGLRDPSIEALISLRGGYGSNYLLDEALAAEVGASAPKCLIGFSDITSLEIFLWQKLGWTSIYGPMVAAGLDGGAGGAKGYDEASFRSAIGVGATNNAWSMSLQGSALASGTAEGVLLGGCLTLVATTLGTPWELDTRGAILLLEDRGMKPWQVDRALIHLQQAGKFKDVRGIVLGDFPDCAAPVEGSPTVLDVCERILKPLGIPIVFGAPVGHTVRPMLTVPLGVRARLSAAGAGTLEILEGAVTP
ncbi:MAG TPA: LD-carboxypeptidase [Candidatus Acidoferrum sp.]